MRCTNFARIIPHALHSQDHLPYLSKAIVSKSRVEYGFLGHDASGKAVRHQVEEGAYLSEVMQLRGYFSIDWNY